MTACKTAAKTLSEEQTENGQNSDNIIPFDSRKFSGDIEDIFYAEDSHILVYADKFQLYDTAADTMTGEFSVNEGRVQERAFFSLSGGYERHVGSYLPHIHLYGMSAVSHLQTTRNQD